MLNDVIPKVDVKRCLPCYFTECPELIIISKKKPTFSGIFQHTENCVPLRDLKNLNLSEKPLQNLTVTNATTNVPKCTTVHYFVPYGTLLKGETL